MSKSKIDPSVTLATVKPTDTAETVLKRLG